MSEGDRPPRTSKESAVRQWEDALELLDGETDDERFLLEADIHDYDDRREIEEIIHHGDVSHFGALEDAWDDLNNEFDHLWD